MTIKNTPDLWLRDFPFKADDKHKYDYGHALIYAAPKLTGATRLAAEACARIGAGLVTVLSPLEMANVYRAALPPHIMVQDQPDWFSDHITAVLYGPGGCSKKAAFRQNVVTVLDAAALVDLPGDIKGQAILTPHEGEFAKAFPNIKGGREDRAVQAAQQSGAVVVLKGKHSVITHPDGRFAVNKHDCPYLATAGTGDVLAGMITGLAATGMELFMAACAAVWIHGDCARRFGPGLVAGDLARLIPQSLNDLYAKR